MIKINNIKILLTTVAITIIYSGCASSVGSKDLSKSTTKVLIGVDETTYSVKNSYEKSKHIVNSSLNSVKNLFTNITTDIYESKVAQLMLSDDKILEKREDLVVWDKGSWDSAKYIIKKELKKEGSSVDYDGLSLSQKIKLLNSYYFDQAANRYMDAFSSKHKKPKFDKFKSDRENIEAVNRYKYELNRSKYEWEEKLPQIQKQIAQKILATLYGKPKIGDITYDPNEEKIYMKISSTNENFSQTVSFQIDPAEAKKLDQHKNYLKPKIYFKFSNNNIELIGASIGYNKKQYLAHFTNESYQRDTSLVLTDNNTDIDLKKLNVDYKIKAKDIENPEWFYNLKEPEGTIIGYGTGESEDAAKNSALKNIAQSLEVDVDAKISMDKKMDGSRYSSKINQKINVKTKKRKLKGIKMLNSVKKDGIYFVAISYKKR